MSISNPLEVVRSFITNNAVGVLSYVKTDGSAGGAAVEFVLLPGANCRLGFSTSYGKSGYRKYPHILANSNVAVTFVNVEQNVTFQADGVAIEVEQPGCEVAKAIRAKYPGSAGFLDDPEAKFFEIRLSWGRYSDYADNNSENFQIHEFNW